MSNIHEHINQLRELLEAIALALAPYRSKDNLLAKQTQLHSIEKSIVHLQKNNIAIPEELRELKFKLLQELDGFVEAELADKEIQKLLAPFIRSGNNKKQAVSPKSNEIATKVRNAGNRLTLKDLIDKGVLIAPLTITKKHKGNLLKATITPEGDIEFRDNGKIESYNSPSTAAVALTGTSINGWTWWNIEGQPKNITLDHYRKSFLNQKDETKGRR